MAYSSSTQDFVALSDLHPSLARPVSLIDIVLLFPNEIVYDCIILLKNYVIDVYLDTNSISLIVRYKLPYLLCGYTSKMKIDAAVVHSMWMPQL